MARAVEAALRSAVALELILTTMPARQDKGGRRAQHVRMHFAAGLGRDASALDECGEPSDGETVRPLSEAKLKGRLGRAL
jgi:hypothetical protein